MSFQRLSEGESKVSPGRRSPGGRSFHSRGPAAEKLLSPSSLRVRGTSSFRMSLELHRNGRRPTSDRRRQSSVAYMFSLAVRSQYSRVVSASDCGVRGPRFESHRGRLCLSRQLLRCATLGTGCAPLLQCLGRLSLPPSVGR